MSDEEKPPMRAGSSMQQLAQRYPGRVSKPMPEGE